MTSLGAVKKISVKIKTGKLIPFYLSLNPNKDKAKFLDSLINKKAMCAEDEILLRYKLYLNK